MLSEPTRLVPVFVISMLYRVPLNVLLLRTLVRIVIHTNDKTLNSFIAVNLKNERISPVRVHGPTTVSELELTELDPPQLELPSLPQAVTPKLRQNKTKIKFIFIFIIRIHSYFMK